MHFTFFFNVFVFLQTFNFINARVLKKSETNPFIDICSNPIFWVIIALTVVGQIIFVQFLGEPVKCAPLSLKMHLISLFIGSFSLGFAYLEKMIPEDKFSFPLLFKEKEEVTEENVERGITSAVRGSAVHKSGKRSGLQKA